MKRLPWWAWLMAAAIYLVGIEYTVERVKDLAKPIIP